MKKSSLLVLALVPLMGLAITACGEDSSSIKDPTSVTGNTTSTPAATTTVAPTTTAPATTETPTTAPATTETPTTAPAVEGTIELTGTSLGLGKSYVSGEKEVGGVTYKFTELMSDYNALLTYIQLGSVSKKNSELFNTTAFSNKIEKITLKFEDSKYETSKYAPSIPTVYFGSESLESATTGGITTTGVLGTNSYDITPTTDSTFFKLSKPQNACYIEKISIVLAK